MENFNMNQMPPMQNQVEKKSMGPLIAVVLILALIIIGGLYFLKMRSSERYIAPPTTTNQTDSVADSLSQQGSSDDLDSIEADLNATNLDNLDQGAAVIEAQLQ